jgi:YYY domain-containing protein
MTAFWWQPFVREILWWWLAVAALGWLAWPLCFRCQTLLPDRGLLTTKLAGLLLWAFLRAWLLYGATAKGWPLGADAAGWWAAAGVATLSAAALIRSGRATLAWTWANRATVLQAEIAFAGLYAAGLWLRSLIPDATWDVQWAGAEKWGNLAILTSVWRHAIVPPLDPWLAGYTLNYYFFSHFVWGSLARLTGAAPPVAFNLAMATLGALLALGAWSAGRALSERRAGGWWALFLVAVAGTPITWSQAPQLLRLLGGEGLGAMLRGFNFWAPSDVLLNTRNEFPAFNVLLGDLHAHALGLVILLWALCLLAQLRQARDSEGGGPWWRLVSGQAPTVVLLAAVVGCLWATNGWDVAVLGLVALGWVGLESVRNRDWREGPILAVSGIALACLFGAIAMRFLAAFFQTETQMPLTVLHPALAKLPSPLSALGSLGWVSATNHTRPSEWLAFWGFLATPVAWVTMARLARSKGSWRAAAGPNSPLFAIAVVVLLALALGRPHGEGDIPPFVAVGLAAALATVVTVLVRGAQQSRLTAAGEWALLFGGASLVLQLVPEIVYVADPISPLDQRYNTVFKLYYPAWGLAALAGALILSEWAAARRGGADNKENRPRSGHALAVTAAIVFVIAAGAYAMLGVGRRVALAFERVRHAVEDQGVTPRQALAACRTLDATAFLALPDYGAADDRNLGLWMRDHWRPDETQGFLLEWGSDSYTMAGRFAVLSGVPTYLGWAGHEAQWRGEKFGRDWQQRSAGAQTIYRSEDAEEAREVCRDRRIRWVAVGLLERRQFADSPDSLRKFDRIGHVVHREGESALYEIDWREP